MRLKYVVALVLAQSTVFVSLKNIKMVSVGGLGLSDVPSSDIWVAGGGGRGRRGGKLPYEATIYCMDPFELISTP